MPVTCTSSTSEPSLPKNIDNMFAKLQEKIDTAEEAHMTLGEMEMDTAYSPITRWLQSKVRTEKNVYSYIFLPK